MTNRPHNPFLHHTQEAGRSYASALQQILESLGGEREKGFYLIRTTGSAEKVGAEYPIVEQLETILEEVRERVSEVENGNDPCVSHLDFYGTVITRFGSGLESITMPTQNSPAHATLVYTQDVKNNLGSAGWNRVRLDYNYHQPDSLTITLRDNDNNEYSYYVLAY